MVQLFTPSGDKPINTNGDRILEAILYILIGWSVFATANSDFFNRVDELKGQGHQWEYTGKQYWEDTGNNPAILIESHKGTKPRYYWKIGNEEQLLILRKK